MVVFLYAFLKRHDLICTIRITTKQLVPDLKDRRGLLIDQAISDHMKSSVF